MTSQFSNMTSSSNFVDVVFFLLSSLVTGPSFKSMSSLILKYRIDNKFGNRKSEIPLSEFCLASGDWDKLVIYIDVSNEMLPNAAKYSFYRF